MSRLLNISTFMACLLCVYPASAELRDPTRPSGFLQEMPVTDEDVPISEGLMLQAIFYTPENPAALINGRRYAVDDLVGESRVISIKADRVILVGFDGEKELKLAVPSVKTRHNGEPFKSAEGMK